MTDQALRTATLAQAQAALTSAQGVLSMLINLKKAFMTAMSRKQNSSTKLLVAKLLNRDTTNLA
jgi:hypothetical protein